MYRRNVYVLLLVGATVLTGAGTAVALEAQMQCDDDGINMVADVDHSIVHEMSNEQTVDIDEDDVLLGIALANNGASGVSWQALRDWEQSATRFRQETRVADLDRDDVFSALALGVDADGDSLTALACVSDIDASIRETTTQSRQVDLEEEEVLLAIALNNAVGGGLDLEDVADISESERTTAEKHRDTEVDREDTFLALALGAGGSGFGGGAAS